LKLVSTSDITRERWNSFVAQWPGFELMQSYEWGTFKEILGWRAIRLAVVRDGRMVAGAQMLIRPLPLRLVSVAYVPRGPLLYWDDEEAVQVLLPA
jgi:lipid II:glycine glycyltransferase (peptidoglycan interpeptide bridge formation enzyme)